MSILSSNLKLLRLKSGLKQVEFAEKLKISASNLSNYEIGKVEPDIDTLVKITKYYQVPIDSLVKSDLTIIARNLIDGNLIANKELAKKTKKGKLKGNVSGNLIVNDPDLQPLLKMPKVVTVDQAGKDNVVMVPVKSRAGYLAGYGDETWIESLPSYRLPGLSNGVYRAFEIEGHSMVPTFNESDVIVGRFIDNLSQIRDNRVHIVVTKRDGIVVKRVVNRIENDERLILNSDNFRSKTDYPPLIISPGDILEIWYAIMHITSQMRAPGELYTRMTDVESRVTIIEEMVKRLT